MKRLFLVIALFFVPQVIFAISESDIAFKMEDLHRVSSVLIEVQHR